MHFLHITNLCKIRTSPFSTCKDFLQVYNTPFLRVIPTVKEYMMVN